MRWPLPIECVSPEQLLGPPAPGAVIVCAASPGHRTLALLVWQRGPLALPHGQPPLRRILLPKGPSLDDLLAAYLCATLVTSEDGATPALPADMELLCHYAAHLREGVLPGSVAPERSLGGMYLAMLELHRGQPEAILSRGGRLLHQAILAISAGRSLLHEDLFSRDDHFAREQAYLADDHRRYVRDREAGSRLSVRAGHLTAQLLHLRQPTSILFRLFVGRDAAAPGGQGFDLILVQRPGQAPGHTHFAFWADPTRRLQLQRMLVPLCAELTRMERTMAGPGCEPWYDGARHDHQRLASPRPGTMLDPETVCTVIYRVLRARSHPGSGLLGRLAGRKGGMLAGAALSLPWLFFAGKPHPPAPAPPLSRGDWQAHRLPDGPQASEQEQKDLLRGSVRHYAVLVAAGAYPPRSQGGLGPLRTPWRDACVLRDQLVRRFGYRPSDVITLGDSPCLPDAAGPPTRRQLLWTVEHLPIRREDTLLFYYAGHGAIEDEPGGRYGYLQPSGWDQQGVSREDRGLRMRVLAELLRDKVAARHQLLLIDACHSGETAIVRGDDPAGLSHLLAPVRADWQERPVYAVITAAGTEDLALEERLIDSPYPHSLFMRALLQGLSYRRVRTPAGPLCRLRADEDPRDRPDGLVTDGELFKYVARRVPELRAAIPVPGLPDEAQRQVPEWNPWAATPRVVDPKERIGEFIFVPHTPPPRDCEDDDPPEPEACRPEACSR